LCSFLSISEKCIRKSPVFLRFFSVLEETKQTTSFGLLIGLF
jgi:hypothetical protein